MKKALAALALAGGAIALASPALAEDPPAVPVIPGHYMLTDVIDGETYDVTVTQNCGPACFTLDDTEFRWSGEKWTSDSGMTTVDGIAFTNRFGRTGTLS